MSCWIETFDCNHNSDEMSTSLTGKHAVDETRIPADLQNSCHKHHPRSTGRSNSLGTLNWLCCNPIIFSSVLRPRECVEANE